VKMGRLLIALMCCCYTSVLLPHTVTADGGRVDRISYVALGDSIAEGAAASGDYGYVYRFRDALTAVRGEVDLLNVAHGGFTTPELLTQLSSDEHLALALRSADVITLSIGGNHMLACARDNFATIDEECVASGVKLFQRDWPDVVSQIRGGRIGARGALLVPTLFNPYPGDDPNFLAVERPIQLINDSIGNTVSRSAYDYVVVDVHGHFSGRSVGGAWNACLWSSFCQAVRDPHPNDAGHEEIARLHLREYLARI
jgi:lysophospholipase L1-like esterase